MLQYLFLSQMPPKGSKRSGNTLGDIHSYSFGKGSFLTYVWDLVCFLGNFVCLVFLRRLMGSMFFLLLEQPCAKAPHVSHGKALCHKKIQQGGLKICILASVGDVHATFIECFHGLF